MTSRLRFLLILIAVMSSLALVFSGCEVEDEEDGTDTVQTDTSNPDSTVEDTTITPDYRFVRIDDLTEDPGTRYDAGADIDAVILTKNSTGATSYAESIEGYIHGGGQGDNVDPTQALGAPDAFPNYDGDASECVLEDDNGDDTFVSLGGVGGTLIVRMTDKIETGDNLMILEVGGCDYGGGEAFAEDVEVQIAVSSDVDTAQWVSLGSGTGPEIGFNVPTL